MDQPRIHSKIYSFRIESNTRPTKSIEYKIDNAGCHICISHHRDSWGYPILKRNGYTSHMSRFVYKKYKGMMSRKKMVMHTCDNPACINPDHLILGTQLDNMRDRQKKGRFNYLRDGTFRENHQGEKNSKAKLNDKIVKSIKTDHTTPSSQLAILYGVCRQTIWRIRNDSAWKHIQKQSKGVIA